MNSAIFKEGWNLIFCTMDCSYKSDKWDFLKMVECLGGCRRWCSIRKTWLQFSIIFPILLCWTSRSRKSVIVILPTSQLCCANCCTNCISTCYNQQGGIRWGYMILIIGTLCFCLYSFGFFYVLLLPGWLI